MVNYLLVAIATIFLAAAPTVALSQGCIDIFRAEGRSDFASFSRIFPSSLAWVASPILQTNPVRLNVQISSNFYHLMDKSCVHISKANLLNSGRHGYMWFTLNNAIVAGENAEVGGRSFVIIQVDSRYNEEGESLISVFRNTGRIEEPFIWERNDKKLGGLGPVVVDADDLTWNTVHRALRVGESDEIFPRPLHATPIGGLSSTWSMRRRLIVEEIAAPRKLSTMLISFRLADAATGGTGIPFQIRTGQVDSLREIRLRVISEVPDLNIETRIVVRP